MTILAIESSGSVASAAVATADKIISEYSVNNLKTHSQTLLPMIDRVLGDAGVTLGDLCAIAISRGPGSFTGLRIGSATAMGLAASVNLPLVEVSTLEALACGVVGADGDTLICPIIDARRNEVYTGLYKYVDGALTACREEKAVNMDELLEELKAMNQKVIFTGDALRVCSAQIKSSGAGLFATTPVSSSDLRAGLVADLGLKKFAAGETIKPGDHTPVYLRLPSAERERLEKNAKA